jgi:hypothetical protein
LTDNLVWGLTLFISAAVTFIILEGLYIAKNRELTTLLKNCFGIKTTSFSSFLYANVCLLTTSFIFSVVPAGLAYFGVKIARAAGNIPQIISGIWNGIANLFQALSFLLIPIAVVLGLLLVKYILYWIRGKDDTD